MLWAIFCWESLGPAIHVDINLTRATYLNIVEDQVHPFMTMMFPDILFQQDNAPCHTAHIVRNDLRNTMKRVLGAALASKFPISQSN